MANIAPKCDIAWFNEDILSATMLVDNFLKQLRSVVIEDTDSSQSSQFKELTPGDLVVPETSSASLLTQRDMASLLEPHLKEGKFVCRALEFALSQEHVIKFKRFRALKTLFCMLNNTVRSVIEYNNNHPANSMTSDHLRNYVLKCLIFNVFWAFAGDARKARRDAMSEFIRNNAPGIDPPTGHLLDYEVIVDSGNWRQWQDRVPQIEVDTDRLGATDVMVPTVDTIRHETLLNNLLAEHKPLILCGPPGSGKTMTLFSSLRSLTNMQVVGLNFSKATTPESILKMLDHYCVDEQTPNGVVMRPKKTGWLILFCDEINLPSMEDYATICLMSFLRQLFEHQSLWRASDETWVRVERTQFVGACYPPNDPELNPPTQRFFRHVSILYVIHPDKASLTQIYSTFNRAMLRMVPPLKDFSVPLTSCMVEFYLRSRDRFNVDMQLHYIYSPRDLTRWVRAICDAIRPLGSLTIEELVRVLAHEALRLFADRQINDDDRKWTEENLDDVININFPNIDLKKALARPIIYSYWLNEDNASIKMQELHEFTEFRRKERHVEVIFFDQFLDYALRIDRALKREQRQLLLVGPAGSRKTTLCKFVAWLNGLSVVRIRAHTLYNALDFDEDLGQVLLRAGCRDEKICLIIKIANFINSDLFERLETLANNNSRFPGFKAVPFNGMLDGLGASGELQGASGVHYSFSERTNTFLTNDRFQGLFEGDKLSSLMAECREASQRERLILTGPDELYRWFTDRVMRNLHVVLIMDPSLESLRHPAATSPGLCDRFAVMWIRDWSYEGLYRVAQQFTSKLDSDREYNQLEEFLNTFNDSLDCLTHRVAINNALVHVHRTMQKKVKEAYTKGQRSSCITFRDYLNFVELFHKNCAGFHEEIRVGDRSVTLIEAVKRLKEILRVLLPERDNISTKHEQMVVIKRELESIQCVIREFEKLQQTLRAEERLILAKRIATRYSMRKVPASDPLFRWARAQLEYADVVEQIEPHANGLWNLKEEALLNKVRWKKNDETLNNLRQTYEENRKSIPIVEQTLRSLNSKLDRMEGIESISNIPGDVLLSSALMAYSFDSYVSETSMIRLWCEHLIKSSIKFSPQSREYRSWL